jgi:hypothetical protein
VSVSLPDSWYREGVKGAWLTAVAAALGVSEAACHRDAKSDPAEAREVTAPMPSSVAAPSSSASAVAIETVVSASAVASAPPPPASVTVAARSNPPGDMTLEEALRSSRTLNAACGASPTLQQPTSLGPRVGIGNLSCGAAMPRPPPVPTIDIQTAVASGSAGDTAVVTASKPALRSCANHALQSNPTLTDGKVFVSIAVAANGEVSSASVASTTGLTPETAACMAMRMRRLQFPAGEARTLTVAITQTKHGP